MSHSDPVGDMIARVKNGQHAGKDVIRCPASRQRISVLEVLKREGFIRGYKQVENERGLPELLIEAKYNQGQPAIQEISRVSRPGRRVYRKSRELPRVHNGLGIYIVSTPRGVLSDHEARAQNVGGEILCQVF